MGKGGPRPGPPDSPVWSPTSSSATAPGRRNGEKSSNRDRQIKSQNLALTLSGHFMGDQFLDLRLLKVFCVS